MGMVNENGCGYCVVGVVIIFPTLPWIIQSDNPALTIKDFTLPENLPLALAIYPNFEMPVLEYNMMLLQLSHVAGFFPY